MHEIKNTRGGYYPQNASKKGSWAGTHKSKGQGKNRNSHGRGEFGKVSQESKHKNYLAHVMNFTAWCLCSVTAEVFSFEKIVRGRTTLDCGATDTVGSVEAIEAIFDRSQAFGTDHDWVLTMPTNAPCTSSVMPNANKRCPKSK